MTFTAAFTRPPRATAAVPAPAVVTGTPRLLLRFEGAAVLAAAVAGYAHFGPGWGLFALLFLVPDLSMLGYRAGPRIGAASYTAGHSYLAALALAGPVAALAQPLALSLGLIWIAHIGFDRMLGYGLKYGTAFGHTHLGVVGKAKTGA